MFSMSKSLQKEINNDKKDKKDNEEKDWKGKYIATVPNQLRREPYPEMTVQIQLSLYYWNPCML